MNGNAHIDSRADPEGEGLVEDARKRSDQRMTSRERVGSWAAVLLFVAVAGALGTALDWPRELSPLLAAMLVVSYAAASRVRFYVGAGFTVPTQLVMVPMLFVLPTPLVPALVALGALLGELPDLLRRRRDAERALMSIGDSWHALAPALILTLADATPFQGDLWPIYLAALLAQIALDLLVNAIRDWFELGLSPRRVLVDGAWISAVDGLLAPVGLLAAAAATIEPWLCVLIVPLIVLLEVFARERERRLEGAIELRHAYQGTSSLLADLLQDDDEYTGVHSKAVVSLSVSVAQELGLGPRQCRDAEFAALLHDIGKIAVPKEIINKPGPLTDEEWEVIHQHTVEGQKMLDRVGGALNRVGVIVRGSHEHWNGSGYPDGLVGENIPVESRIVTACDAFNAMTTDRTYRKALTLDVALQELRDCAGSQFDPDVVQALIRILQAGGVESFDENPRHPAQPGARGPASEPALVS